MRETFWSQLGLSHSKPSISPISTHSATPTPLVTWAAIHHAFLTIYAAPWNVIITLMQYNAEKNQRTDSSDHLSDCLWQMEMLLFGEPWRFNHFRGSPKPSWFFLQYETELLQYGEDSNFWSTPCLGKRRSATIKSVQTRHLPPMCFLISSIIAAYIASSITASLPQNPESMNEWIHNPLACLSFSCLSCILLLTAVHSKQCFFINPSSPVQVLSQKDCSSFANIIFWIYLCLLCNKCLSVSCVLRN